jgi:hypothetical protein
VDWRRIGTPACAKASISFITLTEATGIAGKTSRP